MAAEKVWCKCLNVAIHLAEKVVSLPHSEGERERERESERVEAAKWFLTRTKCERVGVGKLTVAGIQKLYDCLVETTQLTSSYDESVWRVFRCLNCKDDVCALLTRPSNRTHKQADALYLSGRVVCSLKEKEDIEKHESFSHAFGVVIDPQSFQCNTVLRAPDPEDQVRLSFFLSLQNKLDHFVSLESEKSRKRIEEFTAQESEKLQALEARTVKERKAIWHMIWPNSSPQRIDEEKPSLSSNPPLSLSHTHSHSPSPSHSKGSVAFRSLSKEPERKEREKEKEREREREREKEREREREEKENDSVRLEKERERERERDKELERESEKERKETETKDAENAETKEDGEKEPARERKERVTFQDDPASSSALSLSLSHAQKHRSSRSRTTIQYPSNSASLFRDEKVIERERREREKEREREREKDPLADAELFLPGSLEKSSDFPKTFDAEDEKSEEKPRDRERNWGGGGGEEDEDRGVSSSLPMSIPGQFANWQRKESRKASRSYKPRAPHELVDAQERSDFDGTFDVPLSRNRARTNDMRFLM